MQVLREKLDEIVKTNDQLTNENKRLQILAGRSSTTSSKGGATSLTRGDDDTVNYQPFTGLRSTLRV